MPAAKKKKAVKKKRKAPIRRVAAAKKKKKAAPVVVEDTSNPLNDPKFMGRLAQACKYIDANSRPAKQSPQQRKLLAEVAELYLKYGINVRGAELTPEEKEILTGFVRKQ